MLMAEASVDPKGMIKVNVFLREVTEKKRRNKLVPIAVQRAQEKIDAIFEGKEHLECSKDDMRDVSRVLNKMRGRNDERNV